MRARTYIGGRVVVRRHGHRKGWAARVWFKRRFLDVAWFHYNPAPERCNEPAQGGKCVLSKGHKPAPNPTGHCFWT